MPDYAFWMWVGNAETHGIGINYSVSEKRVYFDRKKFFSAGKNRET